MSHILERFAIHFFSSAGVLMCGFFVMAWVQRRWKVAWLPTEARMQLVLAAVIIFALSTLREAVDVAQGQELTKAFSDYASWLLGLAAAAWGLYRMSYARL